MIRLDVNHSVAATQTIVPLFEGRRRNRDDGKKFEKYSMEDIFTFSPPSPLLSPFALTDDLRDAHVNFSWEKYYVYTICVPVCIAARSAGIRFH